MNEIFEVALDGTGWGAYNYFLMVLCCMFSMAEAGASMIIILVIPLLACDLNFGKNEVISLYAILSLGMAIGVFFFGTVTDANGRRGTIVLTLAVIFCASIALAFAQTHFLISLSVFVLGAGLASSNASLRVYLIECLPMKKRGCCLAVLDAMWFVGYLSALGISWSIIPSVLRALGKHFRPSSWRVLVGLGGMPCLMMSCMAGLLPRSPRYLLCRRRQDEALSVLQQMYAINSSKHADTYPRTNLSNCIRPDEVPDDGTSSLVKIVRKYFADTWRRIREMHESPFKRVTLIAVSVRLLQFPGYIWLALWNAHVVQEVDKGRNGKQTESNFVCTVNVVDVALDFLRNCNEVKDGRFEFLLFVSISYVLGESFLAFGIDAIGRRTFLGLVETSFANMLTHNFLNFILLNDFISSNAKFLEQSSHAPTKSESVQILEPSDSLIFSFLLIFLLLLIVSGLVAASASFAVIFAENRVPRVIFSAVLLATYAISRTVTSVLLLENYPTRLRGTMMGLTGVLPHLAAFVVKLLIGIPCYASIGAVTVLLMGASIIAVPLSDLTGLPMRE